MADPTLVERVDLEKIEQALAKAEWPDQVIFVQKIEREETTDPPHQCLTHPEERHVAFDIQMSRTTHFEQRENVAQWDVEGYMVNLFCANCTPEQAEVIANIRPWLKRLVADVRRLEGERKYAKEFGPHGTILPLDNCPAYYDGCRCAPENLDEIYRQVREEAFRAGAAQMREAAAKVAAHGAANCARQGLTQLAIAHSWTGRVIRSLPVPPAPSPAHDGKEGANG